MRKALWVAGAILAVPAAVLIALAVIAFPASIAVAVILGVAFGVSTLLGAKDDGRTTASLVRRAAEIAFLTALAILAAIGLVIAAGPVAGIVLLVGPVAAAVVVWYRRTHRGTPIQRRAVALDVAAQEEQVVEEVQLPPLEPVESLPGLATDRLCLMWRRSYAHLEHARSSSVAHQTVAFRQHVLDELERRNADGFTRWLDSGARAARNPSRYVTGLS